ncbi:hypothetical protein Clacol_009245 [Clathrus columnatus]|uniref:Uncharacterized protein n=1 Tax=Clathrus columnatus TaxID=1419009 RepID=A0AAV5AQ85_9AGAM|nr:hypothetical protein Clacol_009245 [Clathrus columnatus]
MSEYTSISRVSHIPLVESGIATVHSTLSSTPIIRTPYAISLSVSNRLVPLVHSVCSHYPLSPFFYVGDRAANKTLDIAQGTWPYPFKTHPEQMWQDVRSVAKNVDQKFAPIVDTFSSVVNKISGNNVEAKKPNEDMYQFQRAFALLQVIKDDLVRSTDEQATIIKTIHSVLTRATEQSSAIMDVILSRGEDAASKTQVLGRSVLTELEKLPPLLTALTSNTSTTLRDTINSLHSTLYADETWTEKLPKVKDTLQHGIKDVIEDVINKIREVIDDLRSNASTSAPGSPDGRPAEKTGKTVKKTKNTRIVTNVNTGRTALNMADGAGYNAMNPKGSKDPRANENIIKREKHYQKTPFENENIAVAGSPSTRRH